MFRNEATPTREVHSFFFFNFFLSHAFKNLLKKPRYNSIKVALGSKWKKVCGNVKSFSYSW